MGMYDKNGIYCIKNIVDEKVYVGSTSNTFRYRKFQHFVTLKGDYHHNPHLQHAYNKYGIKNFVFEILEICDNDRIILERETFWINNYKKVIGWDNMYNISTDPTSPMKGRKHTEETKRKMSDSTSGKNHPFYGKTGKDSPRGCTPHTEKSKELMKKNAACYWKGIKGKDHPLSKAIKQINPETGEIINTYTSLTEASTITGWSNSHISSCTSGRYKTAHGYKWEYIDTD